ncbi:hypothetical protein NQ317_011987 [Molorchus minor]|uniref:Uncharacterized protein n=1 Tax=Molorchus minor TaxID=1323400 RepID=A0ABQ9J761_9CUCU|nr:hypothetical protein NQ317_011987 [Molorchus minor]
MEHLGRKMLENSACSVAGNKEQHSSIRHTTCGTKMRQPPVRRQNTMAELFASVRCSCETNDWSMDEKATALTLALRGDATDILQTLSSAEQADYEQLIKHLEMRYGGYVSASSPRLSIATPEAVMECLAVQAFLDGLRDGETRQALILARPTNLIDAPTRALNLERQSSVLKKS